MFVNIQDTKLLENVVYLRKRYSVSRRGLARLIGMSEYTLKDMEEGVGLPVIFEDELSRLCLIFETDCETLLHTDMSKK